MAANLQSDDEAIAAINVTPLVDVVLVLLVIFLITAPTLYQNAIKVKLPSAANAEKTETSPLEFSLSKDSVIYWGKDVVTWEQLEARLGREMNDSRKGDTVLIRADESTPHGSVIRLMDACRKAGLGKFALSVQAKRK